MMMYHDVGQKGEGWDPDHFMHASSSNTIIATHLHDFNLVVFSQMSNASCYEGCSKVTMFTVKVLLKVIFSTSDHSLCKPILQNKSKP